MSLHQGYSFFFYCSFLEWDQPYVNISHYLFNDWRGFTPPFWLFSLPIVVLYPRLWSHWIYLRIVLASRHSVFLFWDTVALDFLSLMLSVCALSEFSVGINCILTLTVFGGYLSHQIPLERPPVGCLAPLGWLHWIKKKYKTIMHNVCCKIQFLVSLPRHKLFHFYAVLFGFTGFQT